MCLPSRRLQRPKARQNKEPDSYNIMSRCIMKIVTKLGLLMSPVGQWGYREIIWNNLQKGGEITGFQIVQDNSYEDVVKAYVFLYRPMAALQEILSVHRSAGSLTLVRRPTYAALTRVPYNTTSSRIMQSVRKQVLRMSPVSSITCLCE